MEFGISKARAAARAASAAKTADRTLDVFELFAREQRPLTLSEIAALLCIPLSSSHALIKRLQTRGYLFDVGRRRGYFPTKRMQVVTQAIAPATPLVATLEPTLAALRDDTGETVVLAKRQGDEVMYIDVFESPQAVRFTSVAGEIKPLHSTSSGKAILSALSPNALRELLPRLRLEKRTEATVTNPGELRAQVEEARERGWSHSIGENVPDLMAVSAPVRIGGEVFAITIGGPAFRFKPRMARHTAALLRASASIEKRAAVLGSARRG